jgi:Flp pilus assembly pilin Flp
MAAEDLLCGHRRIGTQLRAPEAEMSGRYPRQDDQGSTSVEYALMVTFIAVAIIGAVTLFGTSVVGLFEAACGAGSPFNC